VKPDSFNICLASNRAISSEYAHRREKVLRLRGMRGGKRSRGKLSLRDDTSDFPIICEGNRNDKAPYRLHLRQDISIHDDARTNE